MKTFQKWLYSGLAVHIGRRFP